MKKKTLLLVQIRLATEQELLAAQSKAEEFEKENCDLVNMLTLKEQELDLRLQEKVRFPRFGHPILSKSGFKLCRRMAKLLSTDWKKSLNAKLWPI